jgi:NADPH2:quinone reductase
LAHGSKLFDWVEQDKLMVRVCHTYPLRKAARVHQQLQSRRTAGKLLLLP